MRAGDIISRLCVGTAISATMLILMSPNAAAQSARNPARQAAFEFERPEGFAFGEEEAPIDVSTRDAAGNRLVVDGLIVPFGDPSSLPLPLDRALGVSTGLGTVSSFSGAGVTLPGQSASGAAIGNQINVTTNGSNNTVVVNARQTNNGDQRVILNGSINLDDQ